MSLEKYILPVSKEQTENWISLPICLTLWETSWSETTPGARIKAVLWCLAGISTIRKLTDSSTFAASVQNNISIALTLNFDPNETGS